VLFRDKSLPPFYTSGVAGLPVLGGFITFLKARHARSTLAPRRRCSRARTAQGPLPMMADAFKRHGQVFTVSLFHRRVTFLLGPEVSAHFYKARRHAWRQPRRVPTRARPSGGPPGERSSQGLDSTRALYRPPPHTRPRGRASRLRARCAPCPPQSAPHPSWGGAAGALSRRPCAHLGLAPYAAPLAPHSRPRLRLTRRRGPLTGDGPADEPEGGVRVQRAHLRQGRGLRRGPPGARGAVPLLQRGAQDGAPADVRAAHGARGGGLLQGAPQGRHWRGTWCLRLLFDAMRLLCTCACALR
jgi:hypothetical protein